MSSIARPLSPGKPSPAIARRARRSVRLSWKPWPPTSTISVTTSSTWWSPRPEKTARPSRGRRHARRVNFACSRSSCSRAAGTVCGLIPPSRTACRGPVPTSVCARCPSIRSRFSARATSRWRSQSPVGIRLPFLPRVAPSSSKHTARIPGLRNSSGGRSRQL